jgi:tRNA (guanine-N7-)-methyltransferase
VRKGKRLPLDALAPYLLEVPLAPTPFDWQAVFGNDRPVELEVGFGKGGFLVESAQMNPNTNYVGVEIDRALQLYVATRLAKRDLRYVRVVRADARLFLRDCVPTASLHAVHVYFPDPWWKKRHKKRRVFSEGFAQECVRILRPGGQLHIASDVEEYFAVMTALVEGTTRFHPLPQEPTVEARTNFERKARERGREVWRGGYLRDQVSDCPVEYPPTTSPETRPCQTPF